MIGEVLLAVAIGEIVDVLARFSAISPLSNGPGPELVNGQ